MTKTDQKTAVALNNQAIQHWNIPDIEVPTYPRKAVKEGIVHLGVGGFHRSHLALYMNRLMQNHGTKDWSICGVGLMKFDAPMRDALQSQDCLYTLMERGIEKTTTQVIGSITSYMYAPENPRAVIEKMAHPDTRIVSLTVTESGYYHSEATSSLQTDDPAIINDLKDSKHPSTIYGYLYEALSIRHKKGSRPFTIMSCDNMPENGNTLKSMLIAFAKEKDTKLADWIEKNVAAPNAMVDRVTPKTTESDRTYLADVLGVKDKCPVVCEPFIQWVLEDNFTDGRPEWEKVGVQVVSNVGPYELMKLRLLNGAHSEMGYLGYLAGYQYIHEVVTDPIINKYIRVMNREEVIPLLPKIEGVDFNEYSLSVLERFSNPAIKDQVARICLMGSGKMPKYVLPSISEQLAKPNGKYDLLTLGVAGWFRYLTGIDMNGEEFEIEDVMAPTLIAAARKGGRNPAPLLNIKTLFGADLRDNKAFVQKLTTALELVSDKGPLETVREYLAEFKE
uniref:mannitol 2-dehydrogenase n=1 Tax=Torulaspora microellipsoides TaxID=1136883 RepID=A0A0C7KKS0_9SACH|nr:putative mannitol dehydrogenase [Torulaspora microellipsoides]